MALVVLLCIYAFIGLIVLLSWQLLNDHTVSRRAIRRVWHKYKKIKNRNTIYQCQNRNCNRLFRLYQADLLVKKDKAYKCPHCDRVVSSGYYVKHIDKKIDKPDKWMDAHSDCFRVSLKQYYMIQNTAKKVKQLREEEEAIKRFEEYNKLSTDMSWIEKIQKVND